MSKQIILEGNLIAAKTAVFTNDKNESITYGKMQVMTKDASGDFYAIHNVKVRKEKFEQLAQVQKQHLNKDIRLLLEQDRFNNDYFSDVLAR